MGKSVFLFVKKKKTIYVVMLSSVSSLVFMQNCNGISLSTPSPLFRSIRYTDARLCFVLGLWVHGTLASIAPPMLPPIAPG